MCVVGVCFVCVCLFGGDGGGLVVCNYVIVLDKCFVAAYCLHIFAIFECGCNCVLLLCLFILY